MDIQNIEFNQPIPELKNTHVIAILRPYLNAKETGTLIFDRLKSELKAQKLGQLKNPGDFYDFTRYRINCLF